MNQLSKEKTMTVGEISKILDVPLRTVHNCIDRLGISKQNGKTTYLNEIQVAQVSKELKRSHNVDLASTRKLGITELEKDLIVNQALNILKDRIEILTAEKEHAEGQVKMLVHDFKKLYTTTEIAKELNLKSAQKLNYILLEKRIQYKQNGTWVLFSNYADNGYTSIKETVLDSGRIVYDRLWTGIGRQFILDIMREEPGFFNS